MIPEIVGLFLIAEFLLAATHVILLSVFPENTRFIGFFDLEEEQNLTTWCSSIQLFLVALLWLAFARRELKWREKVSWPLLAVSAVFAYLSLDEFAQIHEKVGKAMDVLLPGGSRAQGPFRYTGIWMFVLGPPFLAGMIWFGWTLRRYIWRRGRLGWLMLAGLLVYVAAGGGVEALLNVVPPRRDHWLHILQVVTEEVGEMAGISLIL